MQNSDFQSQFSMSKLSESFYKKFSFKNIILGAQFLLLTFFDNFNFKPLCFLRWRPIFDNFYSTDRKT